MVEDSRCRARVSPRVHAASSNLGILAHGLLLQEWHRQTVELLFARLSSLHFIFGSVKGNAWRFLDPIGKCPRHSNASQPLIRSPSREVTNKRQNPNSGGTQPQEEGFHEGKLCHSMAWMPQMSMRPMSRPWARVGAGKLSRQSPDLSPLTSLVVQVLAPIYK